MDGSRLRRAVGRRRVTIALAALAAALSLLVAFELFPYRSTNHDEAVYLQQAAMLLDGQLFLRPPVVEPFRPWFFVVDGGAMYPKYMPVPAAMFALGMVFGAAELALAAVAGGIVLLTGEVVARVFDRRTGQVAAAVVLVSPLFAVHTGVFLPYAPTALLNLAFGLCYVRATGTGSRRWAAAAGVAVGLAFFARQYTAILFAAPFVTHALWTLRSLDRSVLARQVVTAAGGLAGVAVTLAYNAVTTGSALTFPYLAFAPEDGIGFGYRAILGYDRVYTPALALEANARVLVEFLTVWFAGGLLGLALAFAGLALVVRRWRSSVDPLQAAVLGVVPTVVVGNVFFWGNLNVLGDLAVPDDGLISQLGPFYHFDLLLPLSALVAVALVAGGRKLRAVVTDRRNREQARAVIAATAVVVAAVGVGASAAVAAGPIQKNAAATENLDAAYEPVADRDLSGALVFLPDPYGPWLNHPFQVLRNDPGYDEGAVYALEEQPFAVLDAFPNRTVYRYTFRGEWAPYAGGEPVTPRLQRVEAVSGEQVTVDLSLGTPRDPEFVGLQVVSRDGTGYASIRNISTALSLTLELDGETATVSGPAMNGSVSVPVTERENLTVSAFVDYGTGFGFEYRAHLSTRTTPDGAVRALTPHLELCRAQALCGGESTYVPGAARPGVFINASLSASA